MSETTFINIIKIIPNDTDQIISTFPVKLDVELKNFRIIKKKIKSIIIKNPTLFNLHIPVQP